MGGKIVSNEKKLLVIIIKESIYSQGEVAMTEKQPKMTREEMGISAEIMAMRIATNERMKLIDPNKLTEDEVEKVSDIFAKEMKDYTIPEMVWVEEIYTRYEKDAD